jgi:hypothetical protein
MFIQDIDVGGTNVTANGLNELVQNCKYYKKWALKDERS